MKFALATVGLIVTGMIVAWWACVGGYIAECDRRYSHLRRVS